jgi:Glyoxalase-like domain
MTRQLTELDHLVVAARTLEEGAQYVADALGVEPADGGRHPGMRTHNRLLGLWGGLYLEIIAPEPDADAPGGGATRPRWFGLDEPVTRTRLEQGPFLAHWVARVERPRDLGQWQRQYPDRLPPVIPMTRGDYAWHICVPEDGALPGWVDTTSAHGARGAGFGIVPTLIQWDLPRHPAAALPPTGIALKSLRGYHPEAETLRPYLAWLGAQRLIELDGSLVEPALVAEFETPDGVRALQ